MDQKIKSSYIPLNIVNAVNQHEQGVQGGESCRVDALKDTYAWMRGSVNCWTGWASDGKTEIRDFLKVLKAKVDGWKFCMIREDLDTVMIDGKPEITANGIYHNLAWTLTGATWDKNFAGRHNCKLMTLDEKIEALEFITKHFYVIDPSDRHYKSVLDEFKYMHEMFGIDSFEIDTWSEVVNPSQAGENGNEKMTRAFREIKRFALTTNTHFDIVTHPRSMNDVKDKKGKFKVVTQFMLMDGMAWDQKMDGIYSIYRPERHLDPKDPKVEFHNLKQKRSQAVGVQRGHCEKIVFDYKRKQYWFDGVNPMTGEVREPLQAVMKFQSQVVKPKPDNDDVCPF